MKKEIFEISDLCFIKRGLQPIELPLGVMPLSFFYEFSCESLFPSPLVLIMVT